MTDPSPEVVAAALALAEAVDRSVREYKTTSKTIGVPEIDNALQMYRAAIAPKRTRAEVDAEFVPLAMRWFLNTECPRTVYERCQELAREETAPEPAPTSAARENAEEMEDPCGCEASDVLRDEVKELRAKISDCANHAQGGIGMAKYPSCMAEAACRWIYQRLTNP